MSAEYNVEIRFRFHEGHTDLESQTETPKHELCQDILKIFILSSKC